MQTPNPTPRPRRRICVGLAFSLLAGLAGAMQPAGTGIGALHDARPPRSGPVVVPAPAASAAPIDEVKTRRPPRVQRGPPGSPG